MIDGKPYASHLAISDHWMVHYLESAGMAEARRAASGRASWMENFGDFAMRHAKAFDRAEPYFGLDYFAVDCAELSDRRLLLFEADVAMIVHSLDSETVFPTRKKPMAALFAAFENALAEARWCETPRPVPCWSSRRSDHKTQHSRHMETT